MTDAVERVACAARQAGGLVDLAGLGSYAWETVLQHCEGLLTGAFQVVVELVER